MASAWQKEIFTQLGRLFGGSLGQFLNFCGCVLLVFFEGYIFYTNNIAQYVSCKYANYCIKSKHVFLDFGNWRSAETIKSKLSSACINNSVYKADSIVNTYCIILYTPGQVIQGKWQLWTKSKL